MDSPPVVTDTKRQSFLSLDNAKDSSLGSGIGLGIGSMDLGSFDFENNDRGEIKLQFEPASLETAVNETAIVDDRPASSSLSKIKKDDELSFENATALVSAMSEDKALANSISLPQSISTSPVIPPTPLGAGMPTLSLSEALLAGPGELSTPAKSGKIGSRSAIRDRKVSDDRMIIELSRYLSALANDPKIRSAELWLAFLTPRDWDVSRSTEKEYRIKGDEGNLSGTADGAMTDTVQRKKVVRRSRSLGSGFLAGIGLLGHVEDEDRIASSQTDAEWMKDDQEENPAVEVKHDGLSRGSELAVEDEVLPPNELATSDSGIGLPLAESFVTKTDSGNQPGSTKQNPLDNNQEQNGTSAAAINDSLAVATESRDQSSRSSSQSGTAEGVNRRVRMGRNSKLDDFELLKTLGRGCAGKVRLSQSLLKGR